MTQTIPEDSEAIPQIMLSDGRTLPLGHFRVPLPQDVRIEINGGRFGDGGRLRLDWVPEIDVTEPNDDAYLAWPVGVGEPIGAYLYPVGDVDSFAFEVERPSIARLNVDSSVYPLGYELVSEDGTRIDNPDSTRLEPGKYVYRVWYRNNGIESTVPAQIQVITETIADPLLSTPEPEPIENSGVSLLTANESGEVSRTLIVTEPGLFKIEPVNLGDSIPINIDNSQGRGVYSSSAFLSEGEYKIELKGVKTGPRLRYISVFREDLETGAEPNDFPSDAFEVRPGEPVPFWFETHAPDEYFKVKSDRDGYLVLRLKPDYLGCQFLKIFHFPEGAPDERFDQPYTYTPAYYRIGPMEITRGEVRVFQILCGNIDQDYGYTLTAELLDDNVLDENTQDETPIYVVGFELSDSASLGLARATEEAGVSFIKASEGESLTDQLVEALEASEKIGRGYKLPLRWILVLVVFALGAGFWAWLTFVRKKKKPASE